MVAAVRDALVASGRRVAVLTSPGTLLPTPGVARLVERAVRRPEVDSLVFGAAAPLGLLAPTARPHVAHIAALTHGHECWWARLPGTRQLLRRIAADVDVLTTISGHTEAMIAPAVADRTTLRRLAPPVDLTVFHPEPSHPGEAGCHPGAARPPTVVAAARLVRQKGVDVLLAAWECLLATWPEPTRPLLRIIGDGPQRRSLMATAPARVEFLGARPHGELPALLRAADVFALPVRTRFHGLYAEGFGLVFAEARASGLPVLAGESGGVADVVPDGVGGLRLPPDPAVWAAHLTALLRDPGLRRAWGDAGRRDAARFSRDAFARDVERWLTPTT